jgi:hypothetical protein
LVNVFAVLVATLFGVDAITPPRQALWWDVQLEHSERVSDALLPTWRLYDRPAAVETRWVFKNEEGLEPCSIVPSAFLSGVGRHVVTDNQSIPTSIQWAASGKWITDAGATELNQEERVLLGEDERLAWTASIVRNDGRPWSIGEYRVTVDVSSALTDVTCSGKPWSGRAVKSGRVVWILAEASSIESRKVKYRIDAHRDLSEGRPAEAVQKYRALIELDPSDRSAYAPLGEALMASGQFREAVMALEIALPSSLRREASLVPDTLAYAYVVLKDERNARRIVRLSGPERDVESRLSRLKAAAAKSGRK